MFNLIRIIKNLFRRFYDYLLLVCGMSEPPDVEEILSFATEREREYDWLGAAESYRKALNIVSDKHAEGQLHEALGLCYFESALQADVSNAFSEFIQKSIKCYEIAGEIFAILGSSADKASGLRCNALALYSAEYLLQEPKKTRQGLYTILELQQNALNIYKNCSNATSKGMLYKEILRTINDLLEYEETGNKRIELVELGLACGEEAVQIFLDSKDERGLAGVYLEASEVCVMGSGILPDENQRTTCEKKREQYLKNALELSERTGEKVVRAKTVSSLILWQIVRSGGAATPASSRNLLELLEDSRQTKNRAAITSVINSRLFVLRHQLGEAADRDKAKEIFADIKRLGYESVRINSVNVGIMRIGASLGLTYWSLGSCYARYSRLFELDVQAKIRFVDQGIEFVKEMPAHTSQMGRTAFLSMYSGLLFVRAVLEQNLEIKKNRLLEDLAIANEWVAYIENFYPYFYQNLGDHLLDYSSIRWELARLENNRETKTKMLQEAIEYSKKGMEYFKKGTLDGSIRVILADCALNLSLIQFELFQLISNRNLVKESFSNLEEAGQRYLAEGIPIRAAETFWRLGKMQDFVGELEEAAESFEKAACQYQLVVEKYPQLTETMTEYLQYMRAWSEIEAAKICHQGERYGDASGHYGKASKILSDTHRWSYLSKYYEASSLIEEAEAQSGAEAEGEAFNLFNKASELFRFVLDSKKEFPTDTSALETEAFQESLVCSRLKEKFSSARALLEEARTLVDKGQNLESARHFGKAGSMFEELVSEVGEEELRTELRTISLLCRAWQKMYEGEIEVSPVRYSEASALFMEAKDSTKRQKVCLLALGNAAVSKALEYGTEFKLKGDKALYASTKQQLEIAARYYAEAGFKARSNVVVAYARFFDALAYVSLAESELDQARRKELYILAEKHFQQASKLFGDGGYMGKKDEVLRHLERVEEGKQVLLTPNEMLSGATAIMHGSADVSVSVMQRDHPIGAVESEYANVQGRINIYPNKLNIGDSAEFLIELINVGRSPALLVKTEQIIPEGFEIKEKPKTYRVEGNYLDMKGKRVDPLKTEEVRLILRPLNKGTFTIKPRILYLDETGKYKSYELEPTTIHVKEMGISGWLKGQ